MTNLIKLNLGDGWKASSRNPGSIEPRKLPIGIFTKKCLAIPNLRFNELTGLIEVDQIEQTNADLDLLYIDIAESGWSIDKHAAKDALQRTAMRKDSYHPVKEYLTFCEKLSDPIEIDRIATTYLGTTNPLYDKMLRATLIAGCQRIFEAGCQFDYVCVLQGQQGIRKSTFWKVLSGGHFNSSMPTALDKDFLMLINREWFYGLEELDQVTRKTIDGKLKNIITSQEDHYRPAYGKQTDKFPRKSVFVGTTNEDSFLKDSSGSRRFWIVQCPQDYENKGETIPTEQLRRDRDRIWCGAMRLYREGVKPMLDWADEKKSFIENNKFKDEHVFKPFAYLSIKKRFEGRDPQKPFSSREVFIEHHLREDSKMTNEDKRQMGLVLRELGCVEAGRKQGERHWKIPLDWSLEKVQ